MKRTPLQRKAPLRVTQAALTVKPKLRKCAVKGCANRFEKRSMSHRACSPVCALALAKSDREKAERKESAYRREKLKTRSDYLKETQVAFNAFIRERDAAKDCICCFGRPLPLFGVGGGFDCGHYRSVGSAPHLRFDERNAHGQTKQCNRHGAGRAVDYRIGLIARIGLQAVEALEADQAPRKWSIDELKEIRDTYRRKLKELKAQRGSE